MMSRSRRTVTASEFQARCLALLDEVQATREPLVVTRRGKAIVRVVAIEPIVRARSLRGSVRVHGDLVAASDEIWK
ncbi:MAG: type II toxin-antitoxin system Phd/YefM family antitoxin [Anaeromyxobacteraceae bacterium]